MQASIEKSRYTVTIRFVIMMDLMLTEADGN